MDVFEHLVDPVTTVDQLSDALTPGGLLFARIAAEADVDRPQHIVRDFEPNLRAPPITRLHRGVARRMALGPPGLSKALTRVCGEG